MIVENSVHWVIVQIFVSNVAICLSRSSKNMTWLFNMFILYKLHWSSCTAYKSVKSHVPPGVSFLEGKEDILEDWREKFLNTYKVSHRHRLLFSKVVTVNSICFKAEESNVLSAQIPNIRSFIGTNRLLGALLIMFSSSYFVLCLYLSSQTGLMFWPFMQVNISIIIISLCPLI